MNFPQYLWRIRNRDRVILLRRGNDSNEPIEKWDDKDDRIRFAVNSVTLDTLGYVMPVGIDATCDIGDAKLYSENHPWDWFNE